MSARRRPTIPRPPAGLRILLAGGLLLGAVGSCELPKPQLPSLGEVPAAPGHPVTVHPPAVAAG